MSNKPVHEIRMGRIKAAVWENQSQNSRPFHVRKVPEAKLAPPGLHFSHRCSVRSSRYEHALRAPAESDQQRQVAGYFTCVSVNAGPLSEAPVRDLPQGY